MKKIRKGDEPQLLSEYKLANPNSDWKNGFRQNAGFEAIKSVTNNLKTQQFGLCVYCEIDLKDAGGIGYDDFRVEHFFPENPKQNESRNDGINYALHWPNLFGCCTGGNTPYVVDREERYSNPDSHCDVPKSNNDWTAIILDPIADIPAFPSLFEYTESGIISVSSHCPEDKIQKTHSTIEYLNLNSNKIEKFRGAIIQKIREELLSFPAENIQEALNELSKVYLLPNGNERLSPFFSTIRWYLGPVAEEVLLEAGYDG
ncbi:retron Ec78 anti-phage system effector HNH endonuclease PtuB [Lelliottia amnigena]|uniref:retron Ec78 anti-phage system effector HNH endonuclease PtuB n=1 Tax=Lelliottia amnigena TaxID=61646 RepID=UPI00192B9D85|nr:retron Ec78 anti-phage system effector HNH endonuclease PtuB [Lelliottia amnigena]MBL5931787.1 TIGR02646 family protein [Lelliottia amnigena]